MFVLLKTERTSGNVTKNYKSCVFYNCFVLTILYNSNMMSISQRLVVYIIGGFILQVTLCGLLQLQGVFFKHGIQKSIRKLAFGLLLKKFNLSIANTLLWSMCVYFLDWVGLTFFMLSTPVLMAVYSVSLSLFTYVTSVAVKSLSGRCLILSVRTVNCVVC